MIRLWAEERDATSATVEGTEHGDHLGVLRFDFGGDSQSLRHVGWDEWFDTFAVMARGGYRALSDLPASTVS